MRVLIVMHVESEGPGAFGGILASAGAEVRVVRLHLGERLPEAGAQDAVLSLGGPMSVHEEEKHPFLREEDRFLRAAAARGLPVLGICLGAQLIAKAAGAAVTRNPVKELGWSEVTLTAEGRSDPLFRGLPEALPVFQWHEDTFAVPEGGTLLATGRDCRNQAVRFRRSHGLQFHLEADRGLLRAWFAGDPAERDFLRRHDELAPELARNASRLLGNFLEIARRPD